ncbi:MAG TPA: RNA polymerase sigma factor, partial [Gaiellaceae bacterium]|nr:RNA polymerase sigma factor [Gaiellaceae bacterium]
RWQPEEDVPEPPAGEESSAEEQALAAIGDAGLLELIERLSPEQRQVLTLKFVFRFSNAEASAILGKSEGAVKSLQHRALGSLQRYVSR